MRIRMSRLLSSAAVLVFATTSVSAATIIYQDDFSGGSGDLNGTTPDVGTNNWVAEAGFNADGSVAGGGPGSATLAFNPVDGNIYSLDVSFGSSSYNSPPDNDWLALGFAQGQSSSTSTGTRFINNAVIGKAWMLQRGPAPVTGDGKNRTWLGNETSGTQNGEDWTAETTLFGGNSDLRILLNTTGGAGNWTATFFAKGTADADYSLVRATQLLASENINSVGIARSSGDITGSVTNFSVSIVPEPTSLAVGLLGLGALAARRRRR